jgi:hypothetical protein
MSEDRENGKLLGGEGMETHFGCCGREGKEDPTEILSLLRTEIMKNRTEQKRISPAK